jgi:hypothetical protein
MNALRKLRESMGATASDMPVIGEAQMLLTAPLADRVLFALENSRFDWRTVAGVADDTGLSQSEVKRILEEDLASKIVRSFDRDWPDDYLYATRSRYNQLRGFWHSFLSVVCDRVR